MPGRFEGVLESLECQNMQAMPVIWVREHVVDHNKRSFCQVAVFGRLIYKNLFKNNKISIYPVFFSVLDNSWILLNSRKME